MVKISDLQTKDVVNITDGKRLGQVNDLELNLALGRVEAIVVPVTAKVLSFFGSDEEYVIPWRNIVKIGSDVILVRLDTVSETADDYYDRDVEKSIYRPPLTPQKK
nr:YlmC/YmxH family sporulation protein [Numidum massiliense]